MTHTLRYSVMVILLLFFTLPTLWMLGTALKPAGEYIGTGLSLLPGAPTLEHFISLWHQGVGQRLMNTLVVALGTTLISLTLAFLAAYALVRFRFPAQLDRLFLLLVLVVKMLPPIVVAIPMYRILRSLNGLDSLPGLMLSYQVYTLPFCIWMLLGFVRQIPVDLEEAATLEGAGLFRQLTRVVLPLAAPGLVATLIFAMLLAWNEFLFALLFIQTPSNFTLPLFIATFATENQTYWGELMAIGVISSLPVLILAGYLQRHLLRGFAMQSH